MSANFGDLRELRAARAHPERRHGVVNVIARRFRAVRRVPGADRTRSHDFH